MLLMESPCLSNGRGSIHRWIQDNGPGPHGDAIRWRYSSSLVVAWPTWSKLHVGNLANFLLDHHERRQQSEQEQEQGKQQRQRQRQWQRQQQQHHHHHHHHRQEPTSHFPSFTCHPLLPCHANPSCSSLPSERVDSLAALIFSASAAIWEASRKRFCLLISFMGATTCGSQEKPKKIPPKIRRWMRIFGHRTVRGSTFASFIDLTELDDSLKIFGVSLYYLLTCPKYHNSPTTQPTPPKTTFFPPPSFPLILSHIFPLKPLLPIFYHPIIPSSFIPSHPYHRGSGSIRPLHWVKPQ